MINIITTSLFVFSGLIGAHNATAATISTSTPAAVYAALVTDQTTNSSLSSEQQKIENQAEKYFSNEPILVDVARCESSFRQYDDNGKVLVGKVNKGDIGVMQINTYYHSDKATSLGYNLNTTEGNMAYAKYLYEQQGLKPWASSEKCWGSNLSIATTSNQLSMR